MLVSPVSGVYGQSQLLTVEAAGPGLGLRYSFRDQSGAEGPWIPLRGPLELTAAPGEQRDYRIIVRADSAGGGPSERRELSYRIDRRVPTAPSVQPEAGTYWDPVSVRFEASPGSTVYYSVQGDVVRNPLTWDGKDVPIGAQDEKAEYVVQAYAVSAAGNRSGIVTARYVVDARAPVLDLLSPVPGTFANAQAVAVTFRNLRWVRYTVDGSDPAAGGIPYTGPVTIDRQGTTTVRVAGAPRSGRRAVLRREAIVTYTPAGGSGLRLDTENGTYTAGISPTVLSSPGGSLYYTLWEKTPSESDQPAAGQIPVSSRTGGPSPIALRLRALSDSDQWGPEYRYFYFVGQGTPAAPALVLSAAEPLRAPARAQVTGPEDALVSITVDGQKPDARQPASSSWVDIDPKAGAQAVVVRAVSVDGAGLQSPVLERRLAAAGGSGPAPAPAFTFGAGPIRGTAVLSPAQVAKGQLVYELTSDGTEPPMPGPGSPQLSAPVNVSVPFGMSRTFKARTAVLDESGGVLSVSAAVSVSVNRKPPDQPTLSPPPGATLDESTAVSLASSAKVYFSLTSDGATPADPDPASSPSNPFIALPGVEGSVVTYRLKLVAVDESGNSTEVYGPFAYTVDLKPPIIPPITGISNGGRYAAREISPSIEPSAWYVRYTATNDGSEPPEPDLKSPELTSASVFSGEEGVVTHWRLKLLAISHNGKRLGEKRSMSFYLDLQPPEVPRLVGTPAAGRVARPVMLTTDPVPADTHVMYSISTDGSEPADPLASGTRLPPTLTLDVPDGVRRDFTIRIAAVDDAGNKSLFDRRYQFTIDRLLPDDPVVRGAEDGAVSARPVTLTMESGQALAVFEMTDDGSIPKLPTPASRAYSGPLLLVGRAGASVTYRLLPRAFNDLGMASRAARMFSVTVDRAVPVPPPPPGILFSAGNPGVAYLTWPAPPAGRILYRLGPSSSGSSASDFAEVTGPVSVEVDPDHGSTITGEAVSENAAGSRSLPVPFSLAIGKRLLPPVFRGARDGAAATQKIELRCGAPEGEVRYETSTDGGFPPTVAASSAPFPDTLVLDAADGQTVEVRIAARAFDPTGRAIPSEEVTLAATIDRTPPDPPVASGIEDGGHYQDARTVRLLSAEGTIYDAVSTGSDPVLPSQTDADRYSSPLVLDAKAGQSVTYRIVAFSVDPAGNRSRETRSWTVTIDKMIVYASPDGNDYADGSRDAPVRSIGRAVQIARSTERKTVFAAAGSYSEDSRIEIAGDLALVGGLDPGTWEPLGLERWSSVAAAGEWKTGASLLSIVAGSVSVRGFELASGPSALDSLVSVSGGSLSVTQGAVRLAGASGGAAISQDGGSISLLAVRMQASGAWKGAFIQAAGGSLDISGSQFVGPSTSPDFAAIDVQNGERLALRGTSIDPGAGQHTRGIRASGSTVTISASRITSGAGTIEAVALDSQDSTVRVDNADIAASPAARFPAAVLSTGGSLRVSASRVTLGGTSSVVGVNARGGDVVLLRNTFKAASTREYLALVRLEDARTLAADNLLVGASAGESVGFQVRGGAADILNNTIVAGAGTSITTGILVQGDLLPRLVNNLVTRAGPDLGSAITVLDARALLSGGPGAQSPVMLSNSFGGWKEILHVEYARGLARPSLELGGVDSVNRADGDPFGGPVSGNLAEPASVSFRTPPADSYRLARASVCLDAGSDLAAANGPGGTGTILLMSAADISADILGNPRPGPLPLAVPGPPRGWDIGAYEYVE